MTRIYASDPIAPGLKVQAEMWHRSCGDGRVRAVRVYRLHRHRDGSNAEEYLLTRYEGRHRERGRIAMSALLRVEGDGFDRTFHQVWACPRKEESDRILQWQEENGVLMDGIRQ